MELEKKFRAISNAPENKKEQAASALEIDLMEDDEFVSESEKELLQAEDSLKLEKVRASLAEHNNENQGQADNSQDIEGLKKELNLNVLTSEQIKEKLGILNLEEEKSPQEYKPSLLNKLAKKPRVAKILTGLGLFSITHNEIQANTSKNSDLNKSELHNINSDVKTFEDEANRPDTAQFKSGLEPDPEGGDLKKEALKLALEDNRSFFDRYEEFKDMPEIDEVLSAARQKDPVAFLDNLRFTTFPYGCPKNLDFNNQLKLASEENQKLYKDYVSYASGVPADSLKEYFDNLVNEDVKDNEDGFLSRDQMNRKESLLSEKYQKYLENANLLQNINGFDVVKDLKVIKDKNIEMYFQKLPYLEISGIDKEEEINFVRKNDPSVFINNIDVLSDFNNLDIKAQLNLVANENPDVVLRNLILPDGVGGFKNSMLYLNEANFDLINGFLKEFPDICTESLFNRYSSGKISGEDLIKGLSDLKSLNSNDAALEKALERRRDRVLQICELDEFFLLKNLFIFENMNDEVLTEKFLKSFDSAIAKLASSEWKSGNNDIEPAVKNYSLRSIQKINSLHESPNPVRFASVANDKPKELYTKMVYGEEEIFTSTFNGMFNILKAQLDKNKGGITGRELLNQVGDNKFRTFVKECAGFNRLDEFLATMDKADADQLLIDVVKDIDKTEDKVSQAVTVADVFGNMGDPGTLKILQKQVKSDYERVSNDSTANKEDKVMYGLLASMFKDNALSNKEWFAGVSKEYPIEKVTGIKSQDLFNKNGVCVQRYRFYESGDNDGINSYNNFIDTYKQQPNMWEIDTSNKKFTVITSKQGNKKIQIFANVPNKEIKGIAGLEEMDKFMKDNQLESVWDVYRGHSFGEVIPNNDVKNLKFFAAGSCGGANRIADILNVAPHAHIMSTEGTGSKYVNDPILNHINNMILSGKDLDWQEVWESLPSSVKKNENFKNYVAPHKNQGVMFLKSYNTLVNGQSN